MSDDPFSEGQEQTRLIRDELRELRRDVEAMVRREVERTGYPRQKVESMVREMVARELAKQRRGARSALEYWMPGLAAVGVVLLLGFGWLGWRSLRPFGGGPAAAAGAVGSASPVGGPDAGATGGAGAAADAAAGADPAVPAPLAPAERAAVYDSLLRAGSPELAGLIGRLESASDEAEVLAITADWQAGTTDIARGRLHSALVQLVLREEARPALVIDGWILRDPCRGNSCGALLELWRERGDAFGMPPFPAGGSPSAEQLAVAERLLVLSRIRPERP